MRIITLCWFLGFLGLAGGASSQVPPDTQPVDIGVNVGGVSDYAVESFFVDAMKQSRHWGTPGTPWDEAANVDAQGWPMQDAGTVILCCLGDAAGHSVIAGTYQLSFQGMATVAFTVGGSGAVSGMSYEGL